MQQAEPAMRQGAAGRIERFEYPSDPHSPPSPVWEGWGGEAEPQPGSADATGNLAGGAIEARLRAEHDQRLGAETRRSFDAGRERGRQEGHQEGRQAEQEVQAASLAAAERERARQAGALIESFTRERESYFQTVEHEVVKLALAVAARILRREAQMDPLLLTGAVRVALGQLSGSTQVRLRVPPAELDLWAEAMSLMPNLAVKPAVTAGEGMRLGDCVIETELGSVDLGIRAQLGEIERGFFDRAGSPATGGARAASLADAGRENRA